MFLHVVPGEDLTDPLGDLARGDVHQEAESSQVDAHHRHVVAGKAPCGAEQGAVAADHHDEVGALRQLVPPVRSRGAG